jgi:phage gp29-like protein
MDAPILEREIATTKDGRDITQLYVGPLKLSQDTVLRTRGNGLMDIYKETKSDAQVGALMGVRRRGIISKEFTVEPGGESELDIKAADSLRAQIKAVSWDRVTEKMHWGVFYGYAVAELMYKRTGNEVVMAEIKVRDRARFRFDVNGGLRLLTMTDSYTGELMPANKFWNFQTGADHDDDPYGLGLAHWLYWPSYFKRHGIRAWLTFLDKFAIPTGLGKYDMGATDLEKSKLLSAVRAIQSDSGIIIPRGMDIELIEASRSGTVDYGNLLGYFDALMAKAVLGQVMTTEAVGGQYKAEVQMSVAEDIIESDDDLISESFMSGPAKWLTEWNYPGAAIPICYRQVRNEEDLNKRADRDIKIAQLGFRPTLRYVQETYPGEWTENLPPSENAQEAILGGGSQPMPPAGGQNGIATVLQRVAIDSEASDSPASALVTADGGQSV